MGCSRNRQAKRAAGVKPLNYKSKSSPCHVKYQLRRDKQYSLGRPFYRHHRKRTQLKCQLATELGLPLNTKFIFRYPSDLRMSTDEFKEIELYHGTVAVINKADLSLVLVVRCNRFRAMEPELRQEFNHTVSTIFQHARARNKCTINGSHKADKTKTQVGEEGDHGSSDQHEEHHVCGWMGCCGWRGGTDKDKSFGE